MRTLRSIFPSFVGLAIVLGAALTSGLAGCATTKEVTAIVNQSNAALMGGSLEQADGVAGGGGWEQAVERIDAFIEQNADSPDTTAPLRLRQAMLLTVHQKSNLAEATWELVPRGNLHTDRDRALYDLWPQLVWWFVTSENALTSDDLSDAQTALKRFAKVCDGLDAKSDTRGYLEEMRAWIALALGRDLTGARVEPMLVGGLARYMQMFDPSEITGEAPGSASTLGDDDDARMIGPLRRRLRAITVLQQYRSVADEQQVSPAWKPGWVATLMPTLPVPPAE